MGKRASKNINIYIIDFKIERICERFLRSWAGEEQEDVSKKSFVNYNYIYPIDPSYLSITELNYTQLENIFNFILFFIFYFEIIVDLQLWEIIREIQFDQFPLMVTSCKTIMQFYN